MVTEVTASAKLARGASIRPVAAAIPMPTKANSPPGPSSNPASIATGHDRRNSRPRPISSSDFTAIRLTTPPRSQSGSRNSSRKSTLIPTVKKKMPSNRPLNGATVISIALRYSVSASSNPARKAPSAIDRPDRPAITPAATITNSTAAMKSSLEPAVATKRNSGRNKMRPKITMTTTAAAACNKALARLARTDPPDLAARMETNNRTGMTARS